MPKKANSRENNAKVLIVDDEPTILEIYSLRLRQCGIATFTAASAEAGLQLVEREKPDVIIIDIIMPGKDGFWLLDKIKAHADAAISKTPVIMLTNLDDPETRKNCCLLGCLFYLVKPLHTPTQLAKIVKEIIEIKKKSPETLANR